MRRPPIPIFRPLATFPDGRQVLGFDRSLEPRRAETSDAGRAMSRPIGHDLDVTPAAFDAGEAAHHCDFGEVQVVRQAGFLERHLGRVPAVGSRARDVELANAHALEFGDCQRRHGLRVAEAVALVERRRFACTRCGGRAVAIMPGISRSIVYLHAVSAKPMEIDPNHERH